MSRALADGLRGLGLDVVSPADASMRSTTTALRLPDPAAALAHLAEAGVVASIVEYGYVRLSLGAYNNHEDVDRILRVARGWGAVRRYARTKSPLADMASLQILVIPTGITAVCA